MSFLIIIRFYVLGVILFILATLTIGDGAQVIGKLAAGVLILYFVFVAQYAAHNYRPAAESRHPPRSV
ncbi:MAG TPA: hypothetical protein VFE34_25785 [Dongiaceae bacterium]|jgi:hypothetical protein|nr:hypothetical protein [Dongiaceae bacterium]